MTQSSAFDQLIAPIARSVKGCADDLLDIREAALKQKVPGECIACFFRVLSKAGQRNAEASVTPLKSWLEANLEIVAENHQRQELERLPVRLDGEDLEEYCYRIIELFHKDRNYTTDQISLRFDFKSGYAASA